jgi:hypothetical protein
LFLAQDWLCTKCHQRVQVAAHWIANPLDTRVKTLRIGDKLIVYSSRRESQQNKRGLIMQTLKSITVVVSLLFSFAIHAKPVMEKFEKITLMADWETAGNKSFDKKPVFLILHGTMAHNKMELIAASQKLLKDKGFASLAITLGLNVDKRKGMMPCDVTHTHRRSDAIGEISFWIDWLKKKGVKTIHMNSHSSGTYQSLLYTVKTKNPIVKRLNLMSPGNYSFSANKADFKKRTGKSVKTFTDKAAKLVQAKKGDTVITVPSFLHCKKTKLTAASFLDYYNPDNDTSTADLIKKVKIPMHVYMGTDDKVAGYYRPELKKLAKEKKITFHDIDGASHFFRDLYLEELIDSVVEGAK